MIFCRLFILIGFCFSFGLSAQPALDQERQPLIQSHFEGPFRGVAESFTGIEPLTVKDTSPVRHFHFIRGHDEDGAFFRAVFFRDSVVARRVKTEGIEATAFLEIERFNLENGEIIRSPSIEGEIRRHEDHHAVGYEWRHDGSFLDRTQSVVTKLEVRIVLRDSSIEADGELLFFESLNPMLVLSDFPRDSFLPIDFSIPRPFALREEAIHKLSAGTLIPKIEVSPLHVVQIENGSVTVSQMIAEIRERREGDREKVWTSRWIERRQLGLNGAATSLGLPDPTSILFPRLDSHHQRCFIGLQALSSRSIVRVLRLIPE